MNNKELLTALGRLKVATGSLACLGCGHEHSRSTRGCAIIRAAISELELFDKHFNEESILKLAAQVLDTTPERLHELAGEDNPNTDIMAKVNSSMWVSTKDCLPTNEDEGVLVIVNGKPQSNLILVDAYEIAFYSENDGWIIDAYPQWEDAEVRWWMPLPEPPSQEL